MEALDAISAQIDNSLDIVSEYRNSREFAHLMEFISKCCTLGSYNAMLAYTQNPKATIVMSKSKWEKLFNKGIKDNARPLMVLMPFAPVCFCFDYADTYDLDSQPLFSDEKQLMDRVNSIFRPKGDVNKAYLPALKEALKYSGVYVDASLKESPFFGGYITQKKGPVLEIDISGKKKVSFPAQFYININTRASENEQLMTLIHETAHLLLQHVDCPSAFDHNCWRTRFDDSNPVIRLLGVPTARDTKETEAEIVKEVLCTKFGIDNKDNCITYLAEYNSFLDKSQFSRELVLNAVCEIEKMITGTYSWKNGLLYKHCLEFQASGRRSAARKPINALAFSFLCKSFF